MSKALLSFSLFDWCSLVYAMGAIVLFAAQAHRRAKGQDISPIFALATVGIVVMVPVWQLVFSGAGLGHRIFHVFVDLSAGLFAGVIFSAVLKREFRRQMVAGVLFSILAVLVFFTATGLSKITGWFSGNAPSSASSPAASADGQSDSKSVLLELGPDDRLSELQSRIDQHNGTAERAFPSFTLEMSEDLAQTWLITFPDHQQAAAFVAAARKDKENVDFAEYNASISLDDPTSNTDLRGEVKPLTNDPEWGRQHAFASMKLDGIYDFMRKHPPRKKAKLAIIDTGVDGEHEDLNDVFNKVGGNGDKNGHGTHCAGIAAANTDNATGMASLNYKGRFIEVLNFAALGDNGNGSIESVAQAIIDATNANADVISLSLGSYSPSPPRAEQLAIQYARKKGVIVVAAAGNANQSAKKHSPANIAGVISVAATDGKLSKAKFSNTNAELRWAVSAPGVDVYSTMPSGSYKDMSGTSMAAPMVSGLLAVMRAYRPNLTARAAYHILRDSGQATKSSGQIGPQIQPLPTLRRLLRLPG